MKGSTSKVQVATIVLLLSGQPLLSQEPLKGIGVNTCQSAIDLKDNPEFRQALASWVFGFFSAFNYLTMNENYTMRDLSGASMEPDALSDRVIGRCLDDPTALVMKVAFDIFNQLPFVDVSNNN